jgi:hypothetical protein
VYDTGTSTGRAWPSVELYRLPVNKACF